jgi:hypothetical protein
MSGAWPAGYAARCVAHVHSTHSDGTATVGELRGAARAAGAQVVLLTDHDTLAARDAGEDGWGEDVLVVTGHEVSPPGGHLLAFGTAEPIAHAGGDDRAILDALADAGGFGIAAHPFSAGSAMSTRFAEPHPWTDFAHPALAGLEVWSLTTDAAEAWRTPWAAVRDLCDPLGVVLRGPPPGHLGRWDALSAHAPLGGLGSQDGHAPGVRVRGRARSVMPHGRWMELVQTVLLLASPLRGEDAADTAVVLDALRAGATSVAVPPLGDPLAAAVWCSTATMPGATGPAAGARFEVVAPAGTTLRLLRDGVVVAEGDAAAGPLPVTAPGLHRAELLRTGPRGGAPVPWLLPSPVLLT